MAIPLENAIQALYELDTTLKPVQFADSRERALQNGLHSLANHFGKKIQYTRIDGNGEMNFIIEGGEGYGDELAEILSNVPRRTGIASYDGPVLGCNSWCRINHFDVERLLKVAGDKLFDIDPEQSQSMGM